MRRWKLAACVLTLVAALSFAAVLSAEGPAGYDEEQYTKPWMDEVFGCRLAVKTAGTEFGASEPILVQWELKNVSQEPQEIANRLGAGAWYFRVKDQLGDTVPLTRYGRQLRGEVPSHPRRGSMAGTTLYPGQSMRATLVLNQFCDLSLHGTYTVTVAMNIGKGVDFVKLKAAPLTVKVGSAGFGLSGRLQSLALTEEPDRKRAELTGIGRTLEHGIDVVKDSARNDESESVRDAAREVLAKLHGATVEPPAPGRQNSHKPAGATRATH